MAAKLGLLTVDQTYSANELREKLTEIQKTSQDNVRVWHSPSRHGALTFGTSGDVIRWLDGRYDYWTDMIPDRPDFEVVAIGIDFESNQTLMFEAVPEGYKFVGSYNEKGNLEGNPFL